MCRASTTGIMKVSPSCLTAEMIDLTIYLRLSWRVAAKRLGKQLGLLSREPRVSDMGCF